MSVFEGSTDRHLEMLREILIWMLGEVDLEMAKRRKKSHQSVGASVLAIEKESREEK